MCSTSSATLKKSYLFIAFRVVWVRWGGRLDQLSKGLLGWLRPYNSLLWIIFFSIFYLFPYTQQNTSSSQLFLFISLKCHSYKTNLTGLQPVSRPVEQVPLIVGVKSHTLTYKYHRVSHSSTCPIALFRSPMILSLFRSNPTSTTSKAVCY